MASKMNSELFSCEEEALAVRAGWNLLAGLGGGLIRTVRFFLCLETPGSHFSFLLPVVVAGLPIPTADLPIPTPRKGGEGSLPGSSEDPADGGAAPTSQPAPLGRGGALMGTTNPSLVSWWSSSAGCNGPSLWWMGGDKPSASSFHKRSTSGRKSSEKRGKDSGICGDKTERSSRGKFCMVSWGAAWNHKGLVLQK